jgi:hypothetical protein
MKPAAPPLPLHQAVYPWPPPAATRSRRSPRSSPTPTTASATSNARSPPAAHAPLWIEKHGLRIAWSEDSLVVADIRAARAAGADAVVGGHPHVTQGSETYRGKPVIYSLGNFIFDDFELPAAKIGWLLRMTVDRGGVTGWNIVEARIDEEGTPHPVSP